MVRLKTFVGVGIGMALVEDQVFVQEGRAGPPMADDENGGMWNRRASNPGTIPTFLQDAEDGMKEADKRDDDCHPPVRKSNGESVSYQQSRPSDKMAPFPHMRRPFPSAGIQALSIQSAH